ncbi:hypothetical protein [Actinoplanes teichomyceticus]|uniref:LPXTG-motif cell wall-anchored protein n=1 Tax=Actinoplanes teichomyceticus TaxID=1867 RepID=A0A561WNI6_ACTTI|nr:hypothetical protein [Actinoplanes teichomyceticus]TWG25432.1 hypothetical protein FHX34_101398 [Actinoplanes teichomyceticus]GIF10500.1 hypothetical protein Ate01nite_05320 [Actinoplanes teichomyceticus]
MRNTPLRRAAVLAAGALLGLAALATPAYATNPGQDEQPAGGRDCTPVGQAKYEHSFNGPAGTASIRLLNGPLCGEQAFALVAYTAPSATFQTPQYVLDSSVDSFKPAKDGVLTPSVLDFKVEVPECYTQVDFVFGDQIINPLTDKSDRYNDRKVGSAGGEGARSKPAPGQPRNAWYNGGAGTCKAEPVVEALPDCEGNVTLKLINRSTFSAPFVITADGGFTKTETLKVRQEPVTVTVPAANAKNIKVTSRGAELYSGSWSKPEDCKQPEVGTPEANYTSTCDGLTFTVKNPENGQDVTAVFTPNKGAAQTVTVKPAETKTVSFPAAEGLTVTVTGDLDVLNGEVKWTKPADCTENPNPGTSTSASASASASPSASATPTASASASETPAAATPSPSKSEDGELALTGAAAGSIAGGAALLLVVGAGLFFLARRRKVNFKA